MTLHAPPQPVESRSLAAPDAELPPPLQPRRRRITPSRIVVAALVVAGIAFVASADSADGVIVGLFLVGTGGALLARLPARILLLTAAGLLAACVPLLVAGQDSAGERLAELAFLFAVVGIVLRIAEGPDRSAAASPPSDRTESRFPLLVVLGALALVPLTWLGAGEMVNGGDTNYPLHAAEAVELRLSAWNWEIGAGVPNLHYLGTLSWSLLAWLFEAVGGSAQAGQRVMLVLWFAAVPASFLFLMRTLSGRWRPAFLAGALVYALNPYFANAWSNVLVSTIGAAVAAPLLLALGLRLAPRAARPPVWLFAVWGMSALLLSLVGPSPQLLAVVLAVTVAGVFTLGWPLAWRRVGLLAGIAVAVNGYWLLPQLAFLFRTEGLVSSRSLESLGLTDWTTGISANTSLLNVLRSAGSWDWFESWAGEPYVSYADEFLGHPLLIAIGLAIPVTALVVLSLRPSRIAVFFGAVTVAALALSTGLHPPFGFLYGWAMDTVPLFATFRSPWYKFGLATTLGFGVLVALGVGKAVDAVREAGIATRFRAAPGLVVVAACAGALAAGWPLLTGDVLLADREAPPGFRARIPPYVTAAADWLRSEHPGARVLWLPRNSDVYRWGIATSPQPLISYATDASVVGDIPFSSSTAADRTIARYLLDLLDEGRVDEALRIARLLGVELVVVRGDVDEDFYGQSVESPAFLRRTLESSRALRRARSFGPWTFYALQPRPSKVFASTLGIGVRGGERAPARAATFLPAGGLTFVAGTDAARSHSDVRRLVADWDVAPTTAAARSRLAVVKLVSSSYRVRSRRAGRVDVERLPMRMQVRGNAVVIPGQLVGRLDLGARGHPLRLLVDGRPAPVPDTWYLGAGPHAVGAVAPVTANLVDDGSFEEGHWMEALDAGPLPGAALLPDRLREAIQVTGGTDGAFALRLLSTGNRAAVLTRIDARAAGRSYSVEFDYRNLDGRPGSFALVTEGRTLLEDALPRSTGWSRRSLFIDVPADATTLDLYLYANSTGGRSVTEFDAVRVHRLGERGAAASFSIQPQVRFLPLGSAGALQDAKSEPVSRNLVEDPSFERGSWNGPIDAGPPRGFAGSVRGVQTARRVRGGTGGLHAFEVVSTGNRAGVYTRIAERSSGVSYRVSFDYLLVEGRAPSFALVTEGRTLLERTLPVAGLWTNHSLDFRAPADATTLDLYLYTTSAGERSKTLFDEVQVVRLGGHAETLLATSQRAAGRRVPLTFERISATRYRVRVTNGGGPFLLNLRENYDAGWQASSDHAEIGTHFRSNGYGNAWVVKRAEPGAVIELVYGPERWVVAGMAVSLGTLAMLLAGAFLVGVRRPGRADHQR